jgi:uncharacterized protein
MSNLDDHGCATTEPLLTPKECAVLAESYDSELFRSRIVMARHGFGRGEYKYFAYPLPQIVATLRDFLYPALAQVANRWNKALGIDLTFPSTHAAYLRRCHADGQSKPTPLLLRYGPGDFNCLHQDIYGENVFPLQVALRFYRRRVRTHRATTANAVARRSRAAVAGRGRDFSARAVLIASTCATA